MTTLALPERWTFAGVDLSSYATITMSVTGADEFPPVRGENAPLTGLHGRRPLADLYDQRRVALALAVFNVDATGANSGQVQARTNLDALYTALSPRTAQALTRLMPDGTTRQAQAKVVAVNNFRDELGHDLFLLVVQFELADPFWYGPTSTGPGSTSIAATSVDFTFTNAGSAPGRRMVIDMTGALTNPRLTNLTTGGYVDVAVVVASTKHLLIDPYLYTVTNDGADVIGSLTHGATVEWMRFVSGANSMRVTSTSPSGASIVITSYPAYI